jgi:hypothetical protein
MEGRQDENVAILKELAVARDRLVVDVGAH